ncbi:MAG: hypothetical protein NVS3B12_19770 [Acidimicrobiales bacterium]
MIDRNDRVDPGRWTRVVRATVAVVALGAYASAAFGTYAVRSGDSLGAIASRTGTTVASLAAINHLANPDRIFIGEVLSLEGSPRAISGPVGIPVEIRPNGLPAALLHNPERLSLRPAFRRWAAASGVPAGLLEAMAWMESGWQADVTSPTGAQGVAQIEPGTARFISIGLLGLHRTLDARVADNGIRMEAAYLAWLLRHTHGDVSMALASYYQGPASVSRHLLPETRRYVAVVRTLWQVFGTG